MTNACIHMYIWSHPGGPPAWDGGLLRGSESEGLGTRIAGPYIHIYIYRDVSVCMYVWNGGLKAKSSSAPKFEKKKVKNDERGRPYLCNTEIIMFRV